ncbi:hypothetical protein BKA93DRAFT_828405 [Sparassis latifolia]|uniref:Uncharacterized protein n=1 Tax=Sparassis crispa TaxID=139825 RepID=A0A401GE60_9APHY|nr:hypothetical protein SCP_0301360 [Sparassis crispa]GBE80421.1 hypothetical protein SCP_0301360 [Sparassis crispa]
MADVPLVSVNLASLAIESFLYGIFFVLFVTTTWFLLQRAKHEQAGIQSAFRRPLFLAGIAMFLTITAHWVLSVVRAFDAFVHFDGGKSPLEFYAYPSRPAAIAKIGLVNVTLLLGDAILIYRLWVISGYCRMIVALPIVFFLGSLASCAALTYLASRANAATGSFYTPEDFSTAAATTFTLVTNILCSSLIAFKLWRTHADVGLAGVKAYGGGNLKLTRVLVICIESAVLYVTWTALYLGVYASRSVLQLAIADAWGPISGIAFMLISARVALVRAQSQQSAASYVNDLALAVSANNVGAVFERPTTPPCDTVKTDGEDVGNIVGDEENVRTLMLGTLDDGS